MARKILLIFFVVFILLTFYYYCFADSLGYGSIADYYTSLTVFQGNNFIDESISLPTSGTENYNINYSRSIIGTANTGGSVLFACTEFSDNYTGYFSYTDIGKPTVTNYTNVTYELFYRDRSNWIHFRQLLPNATMNYSEATWYNLDTPFPFVGSEVLVRYNNQGAYVFGNYQSSTLRITSSQADIENAGIDYPVIFDNAQLNIGLNNLNAYVAVSFQSVNDNSNWTDMGYVILTNNSSLYNNSTHSFYITLQNLINRDLVIGDKIRIEYGWSNVDRFGNPHSYSFYNIYTRSTAYVGGSAYEPAPSPGGGSDNPSSPDYSEDFNNLQNSINEQTQAINNQSQAINNQTNIISGLNDNLFNENVTTPNSIDIEDNTQNNTADLSTFFSDIQSAFTSRDSSDKYFTLTLPNGDNYNFTFPKSFVRNILTSNNVLYTFISAFWYIVFGVYIIFDMKKIYNKFKNGDFEGAMNSSSVDNVVKEALR